MQETWHSLSYPETSSGGILEAEVHVDAASLWFSGHFPGAPILPGIAMLSMVTDAVRRKISEKGGRVTINGIRKVRFRRPVRPGETLCIAVAAPAGDNGHACPFKVAVEGNTVCTGTMELKIYIYRQGE